MFILWCEYNILTILWCEYNILSILWWAYNILFIFQREYTPSDNEVGGVDGLSRVTLSCVCSMLGAQQLFAHPLARCLTVAKQNLSTTYVKQKYIFLINCSFSFTFITSIVTNISKNFIGRIAARKIIYLILICFQNFLNEIEFFPEDQ